MLLLGLQISMSVFEAFVKTGIHTLIVGLSSKTMDHMKGVACSNKPKENYLQILQLPSVLRPVSSFCHIVLLTALVLCSRQLFSMKKQINTFKYLTISAL